jgi:hypothetical protein
VAFDDVDWAAEEEVFGGGFGFEGGGVVRVLGVAAGFGGVEACGVVVDGFAELDGASFGDFAEELAVGFVEEGPEGVWFALDAYSDRMRIVVEDVDSGLYAAFDQED